MFNSEDSEKLKIKQLISAPGEIAFLSSLKKSFQNDKRIESTSKVVVYFYTVGQS